MTRFDAADVRRYYDRHTRSFIRFGQGAAAIHRAVWGPGVTTRVEAFHYAEDRIAELTRSLGNATAVPHLVDLGCGVGTSLCYLAGRLPIRGTGITISPVQARLATRRIREAGLSDRLICIEADYCSPPSDLAAADLAYAIESFVHGPDAYTMLAAWANVIRPGGLLVVCDDFTRPTSSNAAARAIEQFRRGWHVNTLLSPGELRAAAHRAGFEHQFTDDLSPALELRRGRDRLVHFIASVASRWPLAVDRLDHLIGGSALQECLANGWIGYDFAVFKRTGNHTPTNRPTARKFTKDTKAFGMRRRFKRRRCAWWPI